MNFRDSVPSTPIASLEGVRRVGLSPSVNRGDGDGLGVEGTESLRAGTDRDGGLRS